MIVLGIDPGVKGALVLHNGQTGGWRVASMPGSEAKVVDLIARWTRDYKIDFCLLEQVHAIPAERDDKGEITQGMSSSAMFKFGRGAGVLVGAILALYGQDRFEEIPPQTWQKALAIPSRLTERKAKRLNVEPESKRDFKYRLMERAKALFPSAEQSITFDNADAFLIAKVAVLLKQ